MLVSSLRYPLEDDEYFRTLLIGSLVVVGSVFVLPLFVLLGYATHAVAAACNNEPPPRFERYGQLFVDGLKLTAVVVGYLLAFVLVLFAVALAAELHEILGFVAILGAAAAYVGLLYLSVAIVYAFSQRRRIRDAFAIGRILGLSLNLRYAFVAILVAFILPTLFSILQVLLGLTIVGLLAIPATLVYELLVYAKLTSEIPAARRAAGW